MTEPNRTLTDADVKAIVDAAEERIMLNFYKNIGRGIWRYAEKIIITGLVALAAYGALGGAKGH